MPISCRFDAAIPVQTRAFRRLIVSALALSKGATFLPMRAGGSFRNALIVLGHLQSWLPSVENKSRRSTLRPIDLRYAGPAFGNVRRRNATAMERSCNESCALRLIDRREVNSGTQFNAIAQEFGNLGGCAISIRSRRTKPPLLCSFASYLGNLASMSSFFRTPKFADGDPLGRSTIKAPSALKETSFASWPGF
jgi:hypothetical protein